MEETPSKGNQLPCPLLNLPAAPYPLQMQIWIAAERPRSKHQLQCYKQQTRTTKNKPTAAPTVFVGRFGSLHGAFLPGFRLPRPNRNDSTTKKSPGPSCREVGRRHPGQLPSHLPHAAGGGFHLVRASSSSSSFLGVGFLGVAFGCRRSFFNHVLPELHFSRCQRLLL